MNLWGAIIIVQEGVQEVAAVHVHHRVRVVVEVVVAEPALILAKIPVKEVAKEVAEVIVQA